MREAGDDERTSGTPQPRQSAATSRSDHFGASAVIARRHGEWVKKIDANADESEHNLPRVSGAKRASHAVSLVALGGTDREFIVDIGEERDPALIRPVRPPPSSSMVA
jgi:hypothetical protein